MGRVLGAVLAGGRSQRFGSDKAAALYAGRTLIQHAIAAIRPQVDAVVVCGRQMDGETCLPDRPAPDLGPLGGLCAALAYAQAQGYDAVLSVGCDTPVLPPDLACRLAALCPPAFLDQLPIIGLWPARLSGQLDPFLAETDDGSLRRWASHCGATALVLDTPIPNANTPADLAKLEAARSDQHAATVQD